MLHALPYGIVQFASVQVVILVTPLKNVNHMNVLKMKNVAQMKHVHKANVKMFVQDRAVLMQFVVL